MYAEACGGGEISMQATNESAIQKPELESGEKKQWMPTHALPRMMDPPQKGSDCWEGVAERRSSEC